MLTHARRVQIASEYTSPAFALQVQLADIGALTNASIRSRPSDRRGFADVDGRVRD